MSSQRAQRVARQVLQEISVLVEQELGDPRLELVTFTAARMTPDLRTAWLSFSCLAGQQGRSDCEAALDHAKGMLRREIGRRLKLRYVPDLRFVFDDSLELSQRITQLVADDQHDDGRDPSGSARGEVPSEGEEDDS